MKGEWIERSGRPDLLLFFTGWGMDRRLADYLRSSAPDTATYDLVVLYDYRDLSLPASLTGAMGAYGSVDLIAWSLGVWAALHAGLDGIRRAVAINGTPFPVDASRGIPPEIFTGTLENWSDATRSRFERRMFAGSERDPRLDAVRSGRSSADQREELHSIGLAATGDEVPAEPSWSFSKAVIGGRDLVFLPLNQRRAWQDTKSEELDAMPHFPFFHLPDWTEVLA